MKKQKLFLKIFLLIVCIGLVKNTYAFSSSDYKYRNLCDSFEVASFGEDGSIQKVACYGNYTEAKNFMVSDNRDSLAILTKVGGLTKIIDANVALLDLSVNPETLTYFYTNSELTGSAYTYMDTGSLYGGVDGAHLDSAYSSANNTWVAKVKIGNFTGWIKASTYEIVPITWIKSSSSYTVSASDIRHNYVSKIQNTYTGSAGRTIGPKPEMLKEGTYYSFDGHYFYSDLKTLITDNKKNTYENSINKNNPYYNYYMYLSNHTKTTYSSINIDEYIRNNLGYSKNVYGNAASSGTSRLYGSGTFFYYAQEKYGVNAILSLSLSRNETGNGTSSLSINKNNGFGLNAVDSNPTQAANWYASFASSILGYASKWITYGYAHPRDWRYFGPQFGDKWIGMNVKYASDTYWSEKMAANYYSFDKAFGLQDYNYYQLGVTNGVVNAYKDPSTSSKVIYTYPEKEDALVIMDEVKVGNDTWYKVVSDLNMDKNYNEITNGDYNWNSYVYVEANKVTKINHSKNGYISPNEVTEYLDKNYEYDLLIENTELKPKVAKATKDTPYFYDSSLTSKTGKTLLKDRYVMVYTTAYKEGVPVAYLVTSDYFYDQKHWVSVDSMKLVTMDYGKVSVTVSGNQYTWVNYNTEDAAYSKISGLYTNSYVPLLETIQVGNDVWYKVPVSLTSNNNIYGYTLAHFPGVSVTPYTSITSNTVPMINAKNKTIMVEDEFDPKEGVTAYDNEDGDLTSRIEITKNTVNPKVAGEYQVTYQVTDNDKETTTKTITVTVKQDEKPVINASNKTIFIEEEFYPFKNVIATDKEDGDLTNKIEVVENTVNNKEAGEYHVTYKVTDSKKHSTTKTITVTVKEKVQISTEEPNLDELFDNQEDGEFSLETLEWNKEKKMFTVSGYCIIKNHDNSENKTYSLVLVNKDTKDFYQKEISSWNQNTPYDLGVQNGYQYTNSWFKGELDFSDIPNGDYDLYVLAQDSNIYTIQIMDNFFNQKMDRRGEDDKHGYSLKVLESLKTQQIQLSIRDHLITTSEAPTYRNMVNEFEIINFNQNKLHIQGYSYNYKGLYDNPLSITRKIIFENTENYKRYEMNLESTTGPYELKTKDKLDKTYAWYEKDLDLSKLTKGKYSIQVYTKTSNAEDYGELSDMFEEINIEKQINDLTYKITYNKDRLDRLELIIK